MRRAFPAFAAALAVAAFFFAPSVAAGGNVNCIGPQNAGPINGNVNAGPNCVLNGTHVTGNVSVKGNGSLIATNAIIDGNVEIQNDSQDNSICGTKIGKNLQIHNNSGSTTIDGSCGRNSVVGEVDIHNNSGPVTISDTDVGKDLECHNDAPTPASQGTGGNTVGGKASGECTTSTTIDCPSTGCSLSKSDGNTDVTVDVPGGGKKGKLTVTLSPPPQDDGCGPYGEGGQPPSPSGSIVTVNPPGGYTASTPITVDITYNFSENLFEICKSNNGKAPFTVMQICTPPFEPNNVPCFVTSEQDEGLSFNEALIYMTSTDPGFSGHS